MYTQLLFLYHRNGDIFRASDARRRVGAGVGVLSIRLMKTHDVLFFEICFKSNDVLIVITKCLNPPFKAL